MPPQNPMLQRQAAAGEPLVWLSSMGLATGIAMVIFLLGLILVNGISVFWPKRVVQLQVSENGSERQLIGEIVKKQKQATSGDQEWQLYTANRDAFGHSFVYVPEAAIGEQSQPLDILKIERLEFGSVFGRALRIEQADAEPISLVGEADDPQLQEFVDEATALRAEVTEIEKSEIGRVNNRIERLKRKPANSAITAELASLTGEYEALAQKARKLRDLATQTHLIYEISDGRERSVAIGHIVSFYRPNAMGLSARCGRFLHNAKVFLLDAPREANTEGGVFPAIFGTVIMTIFMSLAVTPFGVITAIYLHEYARTGPLLTSVRIAVNNLAGVPSIVFGVFGLGFFVYFVGGGIDRLFFADTLPTPTFGTGGILWASLTLSLLTVPVVIVAAEEALSAVPRGTREAALACGASKWQTIQRVILPASLPGILTGMILAMARGAGEVAPLMLVGVVKLAPSLAINSSYPFVHLDQKFMHLGFHIYDLGFQSPDSEAALPMVFATTLLLIVVVVVLNLAGILVRDRLRRKYAGSTF